MEQSSDIQIIIWGTGCRAEQTYDILNKFNIIAAIDSNKELQGSYWHDIPIISFEKYLEKQSNFIVVVTPDNYHEIIQKLKNYNYKNYLILSEIFPFIHVETNNVIDNEKTIEQLTFINKAMILGYDKVNNIFKQMYKYCFFENDFKTLDQIIILLRNSHYPYTESNYDVILDPLNIIAQKTIFEIKSSYLPKETDLYIIHGLHFDFNSICLALEAKIKKVPIIFEEDGFLCSIEPHNGTGHKKFRTRHSIIMDVENFYINAYNESMIENILNSSKIFSIDELNRAKKCITMLRENKISKYNHQPIIELNLKSYKKNILIIDQVYNDKSIEYGMANEKTFLQMLETAINENPNAEIYIKSHPVKNKGHFTNVPKKENIHFINYNINPFSLLKEMDEVFVCTSQLGFEALMCGKKVHVFGMPFYAGWGVTIDYQKCEKRNKKRSVEEIFYVAYIMCSAYVSTEKKCICEIEDIINELTNLRKEYNNL